MISSALTWPDVVALAIAAIGFVCYFGMLATGKWPWEK